MTYTGYSGYDAESVKRQRSLADALMQRSMQERGQPIKAWTQGAARLADAFFARQAGEQANAAEAEYKAGQRKLGDALLAQSFPDGAPPTEEGPAFDLTPAANIARQNPSPYAAQVRSYADMTGDPMAAMEMGYGLEDRAAKRDDLALQRKLSLQKLNAPIEVSKDATLYDPTTNKALYTAPGDGPKRPPLPAGMWYGIDGLGDPEPVPGYEEFYRRLHPGDGKGIELSFGEDGGISGLTIGGTGTNGKEPAVVRGPGDTPLVTPSPQQLVTNKSWNALQAADQKTKLVLDEIKLAKPLVGDETTGVWASTKDLPLVGPSTKSGQLAQRLKTIKANIGFDELQQMRENSPTGGALGQVAVQEIDFLQSVLGSLEQAQTSADLNYNINRLETYLMTRADRRREAFAQDYPELARYAGFAKKTVKEVKRISSDAEFDALPLGAEYIGPDGRRYRKDK